MTQINGQIVDLLVFLLPGFISTAVFSLLTSYPRPSPFERIVHALIFTFVIYVLNQWVQWVNNLCSDKVFSETSSLTWSVLIAVILGIVAAIVMNHDLLHRCARFVRITKENSYPSEWYSAFSNLSKNYVLLHLYDGRIVYGWPTEWPSSPNEGHFRIDEAEWGALNEDGSETNSKDNYTTTLLVPVRDVQLVEFAKNEIMNSAS